MAVSVQKLMSAPDQPKGTEHKHDVLQLTAGQNVSIKVIEMMKNASQPVIIPAHILSSETTQIVIWNYITNLSVTSCLCLDWSVFTHYRCSYRCCNYDSLSSSRRRANTNFCLGECCHLLAQRSPNNELPSCNSMIKLRWALFVTYTIVQSITSSEMCSLHLTHPRAHTLGAVGSRHCGTRGAVGGSVPCSRVSPQSWTIPAEVEIRTHNLGLQVQRSIY